MGLECASVQSTRPVSVSPAAPCARYPGPHAQFIDAMEEPEASTSLSAEDTALTLAISAAQL
jgi:hypothetical protein